MNSRKLIKLYNEQGMKGVEVYVSKFIPKKKTISLKNVVKIMGTVAMKLAKGELDG